MPDLFLVPRRASQEPEVPDIELTGTELPETEPAETELAETELAETDLEAREDALDIHHSWIVEAPAGSGKTGLLIQRYLKLLGDESVAEPEQVLAITFTLKATGELRERVLAQLQAAADRSEAEDEFERATRRLAEAVLVRDRQRNWSLLDQPGRLNIRTIDSVCSEIANSLPILSGSGGRRSPVEDAAPLYELAARRTYLELGNTRDETARDLHDALSILLLHRDGNLAECERLLGEMLALREQWGELIPLGRTRLDDAWLDANVLPKLERTLDQAICAALSQLAETIPAHVLAQLTTAAADMASLDGYKGKTSRIAVCAGRRDSPGSTAEDLEHWKALMHLLIAPSTKSWRRAFAKNVVGFNTGKFEQEQLKQIVRALEDNGQLLAAICKLGTLPPAKYPAEQWRVTKALFRILNRALVELQLVFAERGECDFTEVSLAARTALTSGEGPHDLEAAIGIRLQHLLVDEMQDTSSSQYELIQTLTRNWDGHSQTAFLVGDPKQSIYLFRQARVERFLRTMRSGQLGDLPVGTLRLTANFRSQTALVDDFNADFASVFPSASVALHPEEVPYVYATSARAPAVSAESVQDRPPQYDFPLNYSLFSLFEDGPGTRSLAAASVDAPSVAASRREWDADSDTAHRGLSLAASASVPSRVWHATVLPYEADSLKKGRETRSQRLADAAEVCRIVEGWRSRPLPRERGDGSQPAGWKIAVLCRSRAHLDEIVAAFKSAAIPFRAVDIDPLKDRPEVQDLVALTRALLHPADRVAWLAILRAPWCGLLLSEVFTLAGADDRAWAERAMQQVVAERGHLLPDEACQRLQRIWPALEAAVEARARLSLAQLVERTWRSLGGDAYLDAAELANATRYLQLLNRIDEETEESSGGFELALLERRLDKLYAAPALLPGAVDLLTIHKSKGLEWDVVIVPALERCAPARRSQLLNWVELDSSDEQAAHVLLAPIAGKGQDAHDLTRWINGIHYAREAAERKRLFYVACTRAREELHLFAAPRLPARGAIKPQYNSLLAAAWPAAAPHFASTAEDVQASIALAASADLAESETETDDSEAPYEAEDQGDPSMAASCDDSDAEPASAQNQLVLPISSYNAPPRRLPLTFNSADRFLNEHPLRYGDHSDTPAAPHFERPEGSLAARALGNAVHAFLEQMTRRLAASEPAGKLRAALRTWTPRFAAVLRSEGLPPSVVERLTPRVLFALESTLNDPTGLWLLSPHAGAATEFALTAGARERGNIRVDRIFRAGPEPLSAGSEHLWIVDYKTTTHGAESLDAFLTAERAKYAPQLEAYAAVLREAETAPETRLALYYPLLAKMIWWEWQE